MREPSGRAARAYEPRLTEQSRRSYGAPRATYDPGVEIVEESYVNGVWVRRRYHRQARPQGFYWLD
jgi:hypothetical protein